jgi:hypothetical protein
VVIRFFAAGVNIFMLERYILFVTSEKSYQNVFTSFLVIRRQEMQDASTIHTIKFCFNKEWFKREVA